MVKMVQFSLILVVLSWSSGNIFNEKYIIGISQWRSQVYPTINVLEICCHIWSAKKVNTEVAALSLAAPTSSWINLVMLQSWCGGLINGGSFKYYPREGTVRATPGVRIGEGGEGQTYYMVSFPKTLRIWEFPVEECPRRVKSTALMRDHFV